MYPGYLAVGLEDNLDPPYSRSYEIINNNRAMAYSEAAGITWLNACDECPPINEVISDGGTYNSVAGDPAPWWHGQRPDSLDFCGVLGLEVQGGEDSTRTAKVTPSLRGGGTIGMTYEVPREMTWRALAIGATQAGLSYGLRWLNDAFIYVGGDFCAGDPIVFFENCPDDFECTPIEDRPVGPCWPLDYTGLRTGPPCTHDWWPNTYLDLRTGPPYLRAGGTGDWCDWVGVYRELRSWLPPWKCCYELQVIPHMKTFGDGRVTGGPMVLQKPALTMGAVAEIEFTLTAATPQARRHPFYWTDTWVDWG